MVNLLGPEEGLMLYNNGRFIEMNRGISQTIRHSSPGVIYLGGYGNDALIADELLFYNHNLTEVEISMLSEA